MQAMRLPRYARKNDDLVYHSLHTPDYRHGSKAHEKFVTIFGFALARWELIHFLNQFWPQLPDLLPHFQHRTINDLHIMFNLNYSSNHSSLPSCIFVFDNEISFKLSISANLSTKLFFIDWLQEIPQLYGYSVQIVGVFVAVRLTNCIFMTVYTSFFYQIPWDIYSCFLKDCRWGN